ncbi:MAG: hypothetical protein GY820_30045 [Gammaproteobacteria bacterium]|nr:hypothetical protein [Gammaproteobacteria bacterium]
MDLVRISRYLWMSVITCLKFIYIGKAAHITAASEGGPRIESSMSSDERKSIDNGIFLCSNCADMIEKNNGIDFSVELLHKWKSTHEDWVSNNLNKRIQEQVQPAQVFNVTSNNQSGGITAGVVNVGPQPRNIDTGLVNQLQLMLPDKTKTVTLTAVMGDGEAFSFATQIKNFLVERGYEVNGVNQSVFNAPVIGQQFNPDTLTLIIGTRQ